MAVKPKVHLRTEKDNSKNIKTAEYIWHGHRPCEGMKPSIYTAKQVSTNYNIKGQYKTLHSFAEPMAQIRKEN